MIFSVAEPEDITIHQPDTPQKWLNTISGLRDRHHEILLLDSYDGVLSVILADASGRLQQVDWPLAADVPLPRLTAQGMGEVIRAQDRLTGEHIAVRWDSPAHRPSSLKGKGVFLYPLGPVRADVAESVLYRLSVMGDEILYLKMEHGFKPRHIVDLAAQQKLDAAADILERTTGTSTVAHALAFSLAVENALGIEVPTDVSHARTILAELERVMSHLGDLAALAVSTGLSVPQMEYLHWREVILALNADLFGHRYMRGIVRPGRLALSKTPTVEAACSRVMETLDHVAVIRRDLLRTTSFLDRLSGAGRIPPEVVKFVRPVGPVGRAAGRAIDARTLRPYAGYPDVTFNVPVRPDADAFARYLVKAEELEQSLAIIRRLLALSQWPDSPSNTIAPFTGPPRPGVGVVEAPRGLLVYRVIVDPETLTLKHVSMATPSARNWYVVPPAVANGNILQDFPIIDASFSLSVAGWDG